MEFKCWSEGIQNGIIGRKYGRLSGETAWDIPTRSFPVSWADLPAGTKSIALTLMDYDNIPDEGVCWIHWLAADIPPDIGGLGENASAGTEWLVQGRNSWFLPYGPYESIPDYLTIGYGGPAPERTHEYELTLYALDSMLGIGDGFFYNELRRRMRGHILGISRIAGLYLIDEPGVLPGR